MNIKMPQIVNNLLADDDYTKLYDHFFNMDKNHTKYDQHFGRYCFNDPEIDKIAEKITPIARDVFDSKTLIPSYSLFTHYCGDAASLKRHYDDNACTYTLDLCLYQNQPWDIGVQHDGQDHLYTLEPNQALAFYGNDQEHWREPFPSPQSQYVGMVFFHFVEPDHWFFSKGPGYIEIIRQGVSKNK